MDHETTDIGSRLQQAREQRGLTLRDIANATKISTTVLNAIEHNEFAHLPGGVFRRAYVRAFAVEVGLNADELVREYRARFETGLPAEPLPLHQTCDDRSHALRLLMTASVAGIGLLIGGLLIWTPAQIPQQAPDGERAFNPVDLAPPAEIALIDEADAIEEVALNPAVADTAAPPLQLEIRLNGLCWVSAVADGERVLYRLMQSGERTVVEARSEITLRVGDAATVAYSINGATGRPLGRKGEAVTVRITGDTLGSLYAEPASALPRKGAATRIRPGFLRGGQEAVTPAATSFSSRWWPHAAGGIARPGAARARS
jgi:cytoskeleton protein RodZ